MPFSYKPLHPTFGAEVDGVDFAGLDDAGLAELESAIARYGFLMFRNTGLDDDAHVQLSYRLGDLDNIRRYLSPGRPLRYPQVELFDAGNLDHAGNILDPNSARAHQGRGNSIFHVDSSFNPRRASYCLLRAVELPPPGNGGTTDFADARTAFDTLPDDLKTELLKSDYIGRHCIAQSRKLGSPTFYHDLDPETQPQMRHRVLQKHPPSGRWDLYVGAHLYRIEGMDKDTSDALIRRLNQHVTSPANTVSVDWHAPGDLVWWDNRAVLHRAGGGTFAGRYKRDMRRTTVHDDSAEAWGLNARDTAMPGFHYDPTTNMTGGAVAVAGGGGASVAGPLPAVQVHS